MKKALITIIAAIFLISVLTFDAVYAASKNEQTRKPMPPEKALEYFYKEYGHEHFPHTVQFEGDKNQWYIGYSYYNSYVKESVNGGAIVNALTGEITKCVETN